MDVAFNAGLIQTLPPPPQNYRKLKGHPHEAEFRKSMDDHIAQHDNQFYSWTVVDSKEARGHQILGCQWVFVYKTGKHGELLKCKARLVVCGNQQWKNELSTRATTLATTALRVLLALIAEFDLETLQLDAVNAFVHADLDETVYMKMAPGRDEQGKVLRLNKALYGLRRSPILWQRKFSGELKKLGFEEVPQEPCIVLRNGVICFFFVDDIVFAYKKDRKDEILEVVRQLSKTFTIEILGESRWFLGMHIIRSRATKSMWLSQKAYIEKICEKLMNQSWPRPPPTPMEITELLPVSEDEEISDESRTLYQQKMGSILFAAISSRPDVAFAASRLSRFNQQPGQTHHHAADRVLQYLYQTRNFCIRYGENRTILIRSPHLCVPAMPHLPITRLVEKAPRAT